MDDERALAEALERVLRPLVRVLLESGLSFAEFADVAKRLFVELSMQEFQVPGRKASVSRAAVLTGLSRKEVQKTLRQGPPTEQYNRAYRVIEGWLADPAFQDVGGAPKALPANGEASFAALVQRYSGDVPSRAILDELVRVGAAAVDPEGYVSLVEHRYPPRGDPTRLADLDDLELIAAAVACVPGGGFYRRRVVFDQLPGHLADALRWSVSERCDELLEDLDRLYGACDRDSRGGNRRRAGLGIYYFEVTEAATSPARRGDVPPENYHRPEKGPGKPAPTGDGSSVGGV